MNFVILGLSHKTADITLREKVAFTPEQIREALGFAKSAGNVAEVAILSTCNRTEIYAIPQESQAVDTTINRLIEWLCHYHSLSEDQLKSHYYTLQGKAALAHLLQVASGLESMIIGEPQVLGQVKNAYHTALENNCLDTQLSAIFQYVFMWAKKIRTQTQIGHHPISFASTVVKLSQHIFSDLHNLQLLLIGSGELIELTGKHFLEKKIQGITIANRTYSKVQDLAENLHAEIILFADIPDYLSKADIVISCTASQLPILGKGAIERALKIRKHKPIFMVDLAVPRDIEPEVNDLPDVYLYAIDDLQHIINENQTLRTQAACEAKELVEEAVNEFSSLPSLDQTKLIKQYRQRIEKLRDQELAKAYAQLKNQPIEEVLQQLAANLTNKFLHEPTMALKNLSKDLNDHQHKLNWFKDIYQLKPDDDSEP